MDTAMRQTTGNPGTARAAARTEHTGGVLPKAGIKNGTAEITAESNSFQNIGRQQCQGLRAGAKRKAATTTNVTATSAVRWGAHAPSEIEAQPQLNRLSLQRPRRTVDQEARSALAGSAQQRTAVGQRALLFGEPHAGPRLPRQHAPRKGGGAGAHSLRQPRVHVQARRDLVVCTACMAGRGGCETLPARTDAKAPGSNLAVTHTCHVTVAASGIGQTSRPRG